MSNLISNNVQLPANVTKSEVADYAHQVTQLRQMGIWTQLIRPALEREQKTALSIVRSHASADPEAGATTAHNNGLLDGIEAALDLYGLEEKLQAKMREMTLRG